MEVDTCPLHQNDAHTIYYYIILQTWQSEYNDQSKPSC
jgi:hypothetical protein